MQLVDLSVFDRGRLLFEAIVFPLRELLARAFVDVILQLGVFLHQFERVLAYERDSVHSTRLLSHQQLLVLNALLLRGLLCIHHVLILVQYEVSLQVVVTQRFSEIAR